MLCSSRLAGIYFEIFDSEIDAGATTARRSVRLLLAAARQTPTTPTAVTETETVLKVHGRATTSLDRVRRDRTLTRRQQVKSRGAGHEHKQG